MIFALLVLSVLIEHSYAGAYSDPHFVDNRTVMVHLMEWRYEDIAKECEEFLGPYGYAGVQLTPVGENAVIDRRPWYERYQPVSYKLVTRSGNEDDLKDMVHRCNKVGVRIYVDVVLNHMTGGSVGNGTAGNSYDGNAQQYDGVPFNASDFHGHESCPTEDLEVHNTDNATEARNCRLLGLRDLNQRKDWVREKQTEFLNHLIDIGVAGFRCDASKHQWPEDMTAIISKLKPLNSSYFDSNAKPFIYHEVSPGAISADEYLSIGRAIEFKYFLNMGKVFRKMDNHLLKNLTNWGKPWNMLASDDALVMIDSHDLQRGPPGDLSINIAYFESKLLKMSTAFMLSWPYGITRVMSSYYWDRKIKDNKDENYWMGPPHDSDYNILAVKRNADLTCGKEWVCEHRWRQIYNMVHFRNIVGDEGVDHWWDNGANQIAFSRGNKGFIAINNDDKPMDENLNTGLAPGHYCDIISGNKNGTNCTERVITVDSKGMAHIVVDNKWDDPFIAIHLDSKL